MKFIAVITTVGSQSQARAMARSIVEQRLAACAQISAIESFYTWKDALVQDDEFRILFKTTEDSYPAIEAAIRALHTYELPAICAVPLEQVYAPFGEWIASHSGGT